MSKAFVKGAAPFFKAASWFKSLNIKGPSNRTRSARSPWTTSRTSTCWCSSIPWTSLLCAPPRSWNSPRRLKSSTPSTPKWLECQLTQCTLTRNGLRPPENKEDLVDWISHWYPISPKKSPEIMESWFLRLVSPWEAPSSSTLSKPSDMSL